MMDIDGSIVSAERNGDMKENSERRRRNMNA